MYVYNNDYVNVGTNFNGVFEVALRHDPFRNNVITNSKECEYLWNLLMIKKN